MFDPWPSTPALLLLKILLQMLLISGHKENFRVFWSCSCMFNIFDPLNRVDVGQRFFPRENLICQDQVQKCQIDRFICNVRGDTHPTSVTERVVRDPYRFLLKPAFREKVESILKNGGISIAAPGVKEARCFVSGQISSKEDAVKYLHHCILRDNMPFPYRVAGGCFG